MTEVLISYGGEKDEYRKRRKIKKKKSPVDPAIHRLENNWPD